MAITPQKSQSRFLPSRALAWWAVLLLCSCLSGLWRSWKAHHHELLTSLLYEEEQQLFAWWTGLLLALMVTGGKMHSACRTGPVRLRQSSCPHLPLPFGQE